MSEPETGSTESPHTELTIARWGDRFYAWLIDYIIIISVAFAVFLAVFSAAFFEKMLSGDYMYSHTFDYAPISIVFFLYWLILESKKGQSIGKMALHLKITNITGEPADFKSIAISSFGKAFLLPIDVILGRIFTNQKRQRIFNRLGKTIVIKVEEVDEETKNISYKKD
jgi:uncharacterized RDD family membrane protein YckC